MGIIDKFINAMRMDDLMGEEMNRAENVENKSVSFDEYYFDEGRPETEPV